MKKAVALLALVFAVCAFAFANGSSESSLQSQKQSLTVWLYPDVGAPGWKKIEAVWAKEHPNIQINGQLVPWKGNVAKYTTAIASGTLPDVGYTYPSQATSWVLDAHALAPLNSYLGGGLVKSNLAGYGGYVYGGKLYAMPFVGGAKGPIYYNAKLFEDAGLAGIPADHSMSHQEWLNLSAKLVQGTGTGKTYAYMWPGTPTADSADWVFPVFWSAGATLVTGSGKFGLNNPEGVDALKYIVDYQNKYSPPGTVGMNYSDMAQLFLTGKMAMVTEPSNFVSQLGDSGLNWNVGMAPHWKTKIAVYESFDSLALFATSKKKQLGWEWIKFVMSKPIQKLVVLATGESSARLDVNTIPLTSEYSAKGPLYLKALKIAASELPYGRPHDLNTHITKLWQVALNEMDAARLGQKTPSQALSDAQQTANGVLGN